MSDSSEPPAQRLPAEPLRQIDWLAFAPWLILLRVPQATLGWPLVIGAVGSVLLGGFGVQPLITSSIPGLEAAAQPVVYGWWDAARLVGWLALGLMITRLVTPCLTGGRRADVRDAVIGGLSKLPTTLGALGGLLLPPALALALLSPITNWTLGNLSSGLAGFAAILAAPLVAAIALVVIGGPLVLGAVIVDSADVFDAASRMIAYTTQRLGRAAFYVALASAIGYAVSIPLESIIGFTRVWLAQVAPETASSIDSASISTAFGVRALRGFYPAYFFTAATTIYLLLRQDVDGQPFDEVDHAGA